MAARDRIRVEVVVARRDSQEVMAVDLPAGATVGEALEAAGIARRYPDLAARSGFVGIFGAICALDTRLKEGDRVELYRPLMADPKEARRRRAGKFRRGGSPKAADP